MKQHIKTTRRQPKIRLGISTLAQLSHIFNYYILKNIYSTFTLNTSMSLFVTRIRNILHLQHNMIMQQNCFFETVSSLQTSAYRPRHQKQHVLSFETRVKQWIGYVTVNTRNQPFHVMAGNTSHFMKWLFYSVMSRTDWNFQLLRAMAKKLELLLHKLTED